MIAATALFYFAPLWRYTFYIIVGLALILAIIVMIFARRMEKKEIIRRSLWAIAVGIFAIILKYINF